MTIDSVLIHVFRARKVLTASMAFWNLVRPTSTTRIRGLRRSSSVYHAPRIPRLLKVPGALSIVHARSSIIVRRASSVTAARLDQTVPLEGSL